MATHEEWIVSPCGGLRVDTTNFSIENDIDGKPYLKYVGEGSGVPNMYLKDARVEDDKLYITKKDDSVIEFEGGGGGEPETYIEEITQAKQYLDDNLIRITNNKGATTTFNVPDPHYTMPKYDSVNKRFDNPLYNVEWFKDAVKNGRLIRILVYGGKYGDGVIHYAVDGIRNSGDAGYYLGSYIDQTNNHIIISVLYAGVMISSDSTRLYTQDITSEGGAPSVYVKDVRRYENDYHDRMNELYVEKQGGSNKFIKTYENFPLIWKHDNDYFYEIDGTTTYNWYLFLLRKARDGVNITIRDSVDDKMYNLQSYSDTEMIFTSLDYYNLDQQLWLDVLYVTSSDAGGWIKKITHKHIQMGGTPADEDNVIRYKCSGGTDSSGSLIMVDDISHIKNLLEKTYDILTFGSDAEKQSLPHVLVSFRNYSDSEYVHQVPFYATGISGIESDAKVLYFKGSFISQITLYSTDSIRYPDKIDNTYGLYNVDATIKFTINNGRVSPWISFDVKDAISPARVKMESTLKTIDTSGTMTYVDAVALRNLARSSNFCVDVEVPTYVVPSGILRCKATVDKDVNTTYLEGWASSTGGIGLQSDYGLRICSTYDNRAYAYVHVYQLGTRKFMAEIDNDFNITFPQNSISDIDNYLFFISNYAPRGNSTDDNPEYEGIKFTLPANNVEIWLFNEHKCVGILKCNYSYTRYNGVQELIFDGQVWCSYNNDGTREIVRYANSTSCKLINIDYRFYGGGTTGYYHTITKYVIGQASPV